MKNNNPIPEWLLKRTFAVQYNPNCNMPFCVRLVRPSTGMLDFLTPEITHDQIGFGKTLEQAADEARKTAFSHKYAHFRHLTRQK
jgi:hypothetical protein